MTDTPRDPLAEVRGWLANPEWPIFGPGIGRGPRDPGRLAARAAVEQVLTVFVEATKPNRYQRAAIEFAEANFDEDD